MMRKKRRFSITLANMRPDSLLRINTLRSCLLVLLLFSLTAVLHGKEIYVSPQGTGDGTKGNPIWGDATYDVAGAIFECEESTWDRGMNDDYLGKVFRWDFHMNKGCSVRCLKGLREK